MNDGERWLINKVEIRSFLGVGPDGITVNLSYPVTVLEGPSGSGKSTIVSAIEWALFGSVANSPDYSVAGVGGTIQPPTGLSSTVARTRRRSN